jgi:uncharacterized coiled-coil DUF342 family protein
MSNELTTIVLPALVAAITTPVGAWVGSVLQRQKYQQEIAAMRAEIDAKLAGVKSTELDNVRKANDLLVDSIVTPLKKEITSLRKDVDKFRKAIEKIPSCSYSDKCPVSRELQKYEADDQREQPDTDK